MLSFVCVGSLKFKKHDSSYNSFSVANSYQLFLNFKKIAKAKSLQYSEVGTTLQFQALDKVVLHIDKP